MQLRTADGFSGKVATDRQHLFTKQVWITLGQMIEEQLFRHISKLAMVAQVLHMALTLLVERVKHAVGAAVELQRGHR